QKATRESPLQTRIDGLVYAYRTLGHTIARVNPLADKRPENPSLSLRELGFSEKDLDLHVASKFFANGEEMKLREMIARLTKIYADSIRLPATPAGFQSSPGAASNVCPGAIRADAGPSFESGCSGWS